MGVSDIINVAAFVIVILCWMVFASAFLFRKRPPQGSEQKRDLQAALGMILEGMGFAIVWTFRRQQFSPIVPAGIIAEFLFAILASILAISATWLMLAAIRALGKQWSVAARIVEDHQLITEGPYNMVRNPIYCGMLGMLIATGLVQSEWWALLSAIVIFWLGTIIRVRVEEKLLRESFGVTFEEYTSRVPSLLPRLF